MTLPSERSMAVINAKRFLRDLLDPKKTPRVPREIRWQAYYALKHYPHVYELLRACTEFKTVFDTAVFKKELKELNKKTK